jgi:putative membrane protein
MILKTTWTRFFTCGLITSGLILAGAVNAADSPTTSPANATKGEGASKLTGNDPTKNLPSDLAAATDPAAFVKKAIESNSAEIALAEVAQRKAQSADVKKFAELLRTEHNQANQQLQPLAQARGISINQPLDAKHQKKLDKFQQLSGSEFDKEYVKEMLKSHQKGIALYEKALQVQDQEVKQYVQNTLPKLRQHLQHAQHTAQAVGIDQSTITSILREAPDSMGGTADDSEKESGSGQSPKEINKQ